MAVTIPPCPLQAPLTDAPSGLLTGTWSAWFRAVQTGVAGPAGPVGPTGPTGPVGPTGPTGLRGSQWFSGSGAPGTVAGSQNKDWYLDTSSANVWELLLGVWTLEGNLQGASNLDGGQASSVYGGSNPVNGGGA